MFVKLAPMTFTRQVREQFDKLDFIVTQHGVAGMWHRRIDPSLVAETCLAPEETQEDQTSENVELLFRKYGKKSLRVVVEYSDDKKSIISVTWRGWSHTRTGKAPRLQGVR